MIGKLARRLGFQQSIPVSLIDSWIVPEITKPLLELAPREGAASCLVDQFGRVQASDASWSVDITLAAGVQWVPVATTDRVKQELVSPGVVETTITTPSGPVVQRVAAGVVDGEPVAIVEIENTGGVAIAVGLAVRPLTHSGRGYVGETSVGATGISIDGETAIRFDSGPASVRAITGPKGDLLQDMPDASTGTRSDQATCRSGGAQAGAVWPLPHTATLRFIVELGEATTPNAPVPTTADINRGWLAHLKQGMRIDVDGLDVSDELAVAAKSLLTLWPTPANAPTAIIATSELGFARDAARFFDRLERVEDDGQIVRSLARWAQLGEPTQQLEDVESVLGPLARAAHGVANSPTPLAGAAWLPSALVALGGRLHQIDQPDVGDRIQALNTMVVQPDAPQDHLAALSKALTKRGIWPDDHLGSSARIALAARSVVLSDSGTSLALLPYLPESWRGRAVDVFGVPVANGTVSFGLRWHGPRPALFWEANLTPEAPVEFTVPGIDPDFTSAEREGETLLQDPGWQTP